MKWVTRGLGGLLGRLAAAMRIVEVLGAVVNLFKGDAKKEAALAILNEVLEDKSGVDVKRLTQAPRVKAALGGAVDALVELENAIQEEVERQRSEGRQI
ncbi:MAG: hypothetical protein AB7U20_07805, partial [Planctomycetaceae bacterium]